MQRKQSFVIKGMNRDVSASKLSSEYAYEIKNMRIFPTTDNTFMSMVNEKGNKLIDVYREVTTTNEDGTETKGLKSTTVLSGTPIGQAIINDILVVFFIDHNADLSDSICKYEYNKDGLLVETLLYEGNLSFNIEHPIETLVYYENKELQKVYWTDGINQPRMINIAANEETRANWTDTSFDFVRTLNLQETVTISRNQITGGLFAPGTLQYIFTYFDKYGQETNPFYISTLFYTSYSDRGGSPEDSVSNSFDIEIHNIQTNPTFDYVRIYSILRTSIDATPECRKVADIAPSYDTDEQGKITDGYIIYTDTGTTGESVDPTELLYVGGQQVTFDTMAQKDNTLFLGGIELKQPTLEQLGINRDDIQDIISQLTFTNDTTYAQEKVLNFAEPKGYYAYDHQLKYSATQIKTFKYLETYRFGLIFQHESGAWSEVMWLKDLKNDINIKDTFYSYSPIDLTYAILNLSWTENKNGNTDSSNKDKNFVDKLLAGGFVRVKPVVVYPDINDRSVICQGVLCPTMFNFADRYNNSPFVQSSWFARPNAPFDYDDNYELSNNQDSKGEDLRAKQDGRDEPKSTADWNILDYKEGGTLEYSEYSRAGILLNGYYEHDSGNHFDVVNKGTWAEFRHNYPIPNCINRRAEIQCITNPPHGYDLLSDGGITIQNGTSEATVNSYVTDHSENYYIDQSIITLHSPEIEFDDQIQNLDLTGLKLRIVGIVPITATASDIDIQTSTPASQYHENYDDGPEWAKQKDIIWSADNAPGFYKETIGVENGFYQSSGVIGTSVFGWRGLSSGVFWLDEISHSSRENTEHATTAFVIYPWHRAGSLNNCPGADENGNRESMLETKKLSNLRFSYKTYYFDKEHIWEAQVDDDYDHTGISGVKMFTSDEVVLTKIPAPENSSLSELNYYGNSDKLLTIQAFSSNNENADDHVKNDKTKIPRGYPIVVTGRSILESAEDADNNNDIYVESESTYHTLFKDEYKTIFDVDGSGCGHGNSKNFLQTAYCYGTDPVRIKYKSTPHAVMALNYNTNGEQRVLPCIGNINHIIQGEDFTKHFYWDKKGSSVGVSQDSISDSLVPKEEDLSDVEGLHYGWLWLGELYRDDNQIKNRFGGDTEEALEQNVWVACGESVSLKDPMTTEDNEESVTKTISIKWTEGDTYYQRYDHIKTYPFTLEDQNSVTDIISFMCETRVNLDGRYDRNRGQTSNLAVTPENFNQVNQVYSQENNFYTYHTLNPNLINLDTFSNSITWTKTKVAGDLVDTWTNITLASTLDLDGDKGSINALRRYNNQLLAFQDTGISQIKYNENVQLAVTEGVPVELANSGKVDGKDYITNQVGCVNKWSICETPGGLYFVDDLTKALYSFTDKLNNLTDTYGFSSWITNELQDASSWTPTESNNFVTYYDRINNDVLLINKDNCLALSEVLGGFSSFYDYENTAYMANINDKFLAIRQNEDSTYSIWLQHEGEYNSFFGNHKPFWATIIANDGMVTDKIYDTLEFRSNTYKDNVYQEDDTFDHLKIWNQYQESDDTELSFSHGKITNLKKKFNIWRATVPRDGKVKRDRIRSPWAYIKLSKQVENNYKTVLSDMQVVYFDNSTAQTQQQEKE